MPIARYPLIGGAINPFRGSANTAGLLGSDYDGTNDYQLRGADLTGNSDGKTGTIVFSANIQGGDGSFLRILVNTDFHVIMSRSTTDEYRVEGYNAGNTRILQMFSNSLYNTTTNTGWNTVALSWDLAATTGHLYVGDSDDLKAGATLTDDTVDWTSANWAHGAQVNGGNKYDGQLSEVWVSHSYFDLSVTATRRKFIDADGGPAWLGSDGTLPGVTPILYAPDGDLSNNLGSGGDFTTTGALDSVAGPRG